MKDFYSILVCAVREVTKKISILSVLVLRKVTWKLCGLLREMRCKVSHDILCLWWEEWKENLSIFIAFVFIWYWEDLQLRSVRRKQLESFALCSASTFSSFLLPRWRMTTIDCAITMIKDCSFKTVREDTLTCLFCFKLFQIFLRFLRIHSESILWNCRACWWEIL